MQQDLERCASLASTKSITPAANDVLFGRGKRFQNHPGNLRMRKIIRKYKKIYMAQKGQHRKRLVVENAYNEIVSGGARFVKQSEEKNQWLEVMMHEALEKVAHTIRYKPRNAKVGSKSKEDDEEDSSVDEVPIVMAANTVVLGRDIPASSPAFQGLSPTPVAANPAPGPVHRSQMIATAASYALNPLLNQRMATRPQQANEISQSMPLLDAYFNPINRPFLQAGLRYSAPSPYPQDLLLGEFRAASGYGMNPTTPDLTLIHQALMMNEAKNSFGNPGGIAVQMQSSSEGTNDQETSANFLPNDQPSPTYLVAKK